MRKAAAIIIPTALVLVMAFQFTGCEKYVLPELSISTDTLHFGPDGQTLPLVVTTNVITTLYPEGVIWVSADPEWLDETTTVSITVMQNLDTVARSTVLPVKSEAILRNLVIVQDRSDTLVTSISF